MKITLVGAAAGKPQIVLVHREDDQRPAVARLIQQRHRLLSNLTQMPSTIGV
jgi:hypothetical protein